jgi:hypothetical protein
MSIKNYLLHIKRTLKYVQSKFSNERQKANNIENYVKYFVGEIALIFMVWWRIGWKRL